MTPRERYIEALSNQKNEQALYEAAYAACRVASDRLAKANIEVFAASEALLKAVETGTENQPVKE